MIDIDRYTILKTLQEQAKPRGNADRIRMHRNTVQLWLEHHAPSFTLRVPHHSKWLAIIKFLTARGFTITENEKISSILSKYHKIGHKGNVACLMEISGGYIFVEFGDIKNLWKGHAQNFWSDPTDDRYTHLSYLEGAAVRLEIFKLVQFMLDKYKLRMDVNDDMLSPEECIIKDLRVNKHIHGWVNSLEDIKKDMEKDSYNSRQNNNDRNKKKIICGEKKYFYDFKTSRLSCGIVWHHINNMWWVISGGVRRNVCSYDLFDYSPDLPRREPVTKEVVGKLLKKYEGKREYLRCAAIAKQYSELNPVEQHPV